MPGLQLWRKRRVLAGGRLTVQAAGLRPSADTDGPVNYSCVECGMPIEDPRKAWIQVVGYVSPKGKDSMIGRRDTGNLICVPCITRLKAGLPIGRDRDEHLSLF